MRVHAVQCGFWWGWNEFAFAANVWSQIRSVSFDGRQIEFGESSCRSTTYCCNSRLTNKIIGFCYLNKTWLDFITAGHLLTQKDTFLSRSEVQRIAAAIIDITDKRQRRIHLPLPAILKPNELWTGKQVCDWNFSFFVIKNRGRIGGPTAPLPTKTSNIKRGGSRKSN